VKVKIVTPQDGKFGKNYTQRDWRSLPERWLVGFRELLKEFRVPNEYVPELEIFIEIRPQLWAGGYSPPGYKGNYVNSHYICVCDFVYARDDNREFNLTLIHELKHLAWHIIYPPKGVRDSN